jgi:hypothetical protein
MPSAQPMRLLQSCSSPKLRLGLFPRYLVNLGDTYEPIDALEERGGLRHSGIVIRLQARVTRHILRSSYRTASSPPSVFICTTEVAGISQRKATVDHACDVSIHVR